MPRPRGGRCAAVVGAVVVAWAALGACGGSSPDLGGTGGGARSTAQDHSAGTGSKAPAETPSPSFSSSASSSASAASRWKQTTVVFTVEEPRGDAELERTAELMRKRAADAGMAGVEVTVQGGEITATRAGDSEEALKSLGRTAELDFRPVETYAIVKKKVECRSPVPAVPNAFTACGEGDNALTKYVLGPVAVPGTDVSDAKATFDKNSAAGWMVQLEFTAAGAKRFADVTGRLATQQPPANQFAIVLDDSVLSAPSVNQSITGGEAQISGNFTQRSAQELAAQLNTGALPVRLKASSVTRLRAD